MCDDTARPADPLLPAARKQMRLHVVGEVEGGDFDSVQVLGRHSSDRRLEPLQVGATLDLELGKAEARKIGEEGAVRDRLEEGAEARGGADGDEALPIGQHPELGMPGETERYRGYAAESESKAASVQPVEKKGDGLQVVESQSGARAK